MIIKMFGSGCKKCVSLSESARQALSSLGLPAEVLKVTDFAEIAAYGVMSTPALAIDDEVVSVGKVLTAGEIAAFLQAR
ncbi:thioredoxin family protein [Pseudomonas paeninsulae]|uniref:thioredoxin family protein n=1 Tax=Pseudomonas paeninsulae TaxID=3110772 RepID=UPI002D79D839|nr:thioredoxin family protein [Pseudomonas sp. IT1137]